MTSQFDYQLTEWETRKEVVEDLCDCLIKYNTPYVIKQFNKLGKTFYAAFVDFVPKDGGDRFWAKNRRKKEVA